MRFPALLPLLALLASAAPASAAGGCVPAAQACAFVEPDGNGATATVSFAGSVAQATATSAETGVSLDLSDGATGADAFAGCREGEPVPSLPGYHVTHCTLEADGTPVATVTVARGVASNGSECVFLYLDGSYAGGFCGPNPVVSENPDLGAPCAAYAPGVYPVCLGVRERPADCGGRPGVEYGVAYSLWLAVPGYVPVACVVA